MFQYHSGNIKNFCKDIEYISFFTDPEGNINDIEGNDSLLKRLDSDGFKNGGNVAEGHIGTSAPGLTILEKSYSSVIAEEHYCESLHQYGCISAPIYNDHREMIGVIDLSVLASEADKLKILIPYLINIANSIHLELSLKELIEKYSTFDSYFNSNFDYSQNNLLLINPDGKILDLNKKAQEHLQSLSGIKNSDIRGILGRNGEIKSLLSDSGGDIKLSYPHSKSETAKSIPIYDRCGNERAYVLNIVPNKIQVKASENFSNGLYHFKNIIGKSQRDLISKAKKVAKTKSSVLIEGESGTGKELFANAIHQDGPSPQQPFIAINCCAIPHEIIESELFGYEKGAFTGAKKDGHIGKFEMASNGTIFLDEIHTLSKSAQAKLLRVLEERQLTKLGGIKPVSLNIRVISATSVNLKEQVNNGNFLDALYYRINVVKLDIKPLRDRKEDLPSLVEHLVAEMGKKFDSNIKGLKPEVLELFFLYNWPGNVRELRNIIESAFNVCESEYIDLKDLPEKYFEQKIESKMLSKDIINFDLPDSGVDLNDLTGSLQSKLINQALVRTRGNKTKAAKLLKVDRFYLNNLMKKLGMN